MFILIEYYDLFTVSCDSGSIESHKESYVSTAASIPYNKLSTQLINFHSIKIRHCPFHLWYTIKSILLLILELLFWK